MQMKQVIIVLLNFSSNHWKIINQSLVFMRIFLKNIKKELRSELKTKLYLTAGK